MRPAMISILPHTHAFRCSRTLRTARLNDDCRPHPTTVAVVPHYPHTRPPDVPARLVYQRILVNTYRTSDLFRPRGLACTPSTSLLPSPAVVPASTFLVLDAATATCLTARMTLHLLVVLLAVARAALPTAMMTVITPGANPTFHRTMPHLNAVVSSRMKTFPAMSTTSSWSSAFSFVGF
jgi:hypothetical protein